jgi:hypothetical protein
MRVPSGIDRMGLANPGTPFVQARPGVARHEPFPETRCKMVIQRLCRLASYTEPEGPVCPLVNISPSPGLRIGL